MGVTTDGTDEEIALKGIDAMVDFYHSIGMPASSMSWASTPPTRRSTRWPAAASKLAAPPSARPKNSASTT